METYGFKFNPYDPCVANKIIEEESLKLLFHVDDVKAVHRNKKLVDNFEQCIEFMYGYTNVLKVKSVRGKVHTYLSMTLDYTTK